MSRPLIIKRPGLQSRVQKYGQMSIAVFMWALWLWLWLPVVTILLWALGVNLAFTSFVVNKGLFDVLYTLGNFFSAVIFVVAVQYFWSVYNYLRFRKKVRRHMLKPLTIERLSEDYGHSLAYIKQVQAADFVDMSHDGEGNILMPKNFEDLEVFSVSE